VEQDAVRALLPDDARPFVERHLDALERKRLIERAAARLSDERPGESSARFECSLHQAEAPIPIPLPDAVHPERDQSEHA
jgi:hypothetical protein